jgi:hypothetical protein
VFSEGWEIAVGLILNFGHQRATIAAVVTFRILTFVLGLEVLTAVIKGFCLLGYNAV